MLTGFAVPDALPGEQQLWEDAFDYWWWADRFGWTPDQVDDLPARVATRLRNVAMLVDEVRAEARAEARRG